MSEIMRLKVDHSGHLRKLAWILVHRSDCVCNKRRLLPRLLSQNYRTFLGTAGIGRRLLRCEASITGVRAGTLTDGDPFTQACTSLGPQLSRASRARRGSGRNRVATGLWQLS